MSTRIVIDGSTVSCVYADEIRGLLEALGFTPAAVQRASEVEIDPVSGDWVATHINTGTEIGRSHNRQDAIQQEVNYLEGRL